MLRLLLALILTLPLAAQEAEGPALKGPLDSYRVHGRVVDPDGQALAGARFTLYGTPFRTKGSGPAAGAPAWANPEPVVSDTKGRFSLRFAPRPGYRFSAGLTHPDFVDMGWSWPQLPEGDRLNLGRLRMVRPATLTGHLTDEKGDILTEGWQVVATHQNSKAPYQVVRSRHVQVDPDLGTFRFGGLHPGKLRVYAQHSRGERIATRTVNIREAQETSVQLVFKGPHPSTSIVVTPQVSGSPFPITQFPEGSLYLLNSAGERIPLVRALGRDHEWFASELDPDSYTLVVEDPRYRPFRKEPVQVGARIQANLVGSCSIALEVVDPRGEPIHHYAASARLVGHHPAFQLMSLARTPLADGRYDGLVPGHYILEVNAPERGSFHPKPFVIAPGELATFRAVLGDVGPLAGIVRYADGRPAPGLVVQATQGSEPGCNLTFMGITSVWRSTAEGRQLFAIHSPDAEAITDEQGRFSMARLPYGPIAFRVHASAWALVDSRLDFDLDTAVHGLSLPPMGQVRGRLGLGSEPHEGQLSVDLEPHRGGLPLSLQRFDGFDPATVDAGGRFELGPIPVGPQVLVLNQHVRHSNGTSASKSLAQFRVQVQPAGITELDLDLLGPRPVASGAIQVTLDGSKPDAPLWVGLVPKEPFDARGVGLAPWGAGAEGGRVNFDGLAPGAYRVRVSGGRWNWEPPLEHLLGEGGANRIELDVPLYRRSLRVLGEDGKAMPEAQVQVSTGSGWAIHPPFSTDSLGRLELALPPGEFTLCRYEGTGASYPGVPVEWKEWKADSEPLELILP